MKKFIKIFFALVLMTSCSSKNSNPNYKKLLQLEWQLEKINGQSIEDGMTIPTLKIDFSEMRLSGNSGCNTYTGSITELNSETIGFDKIAKTLKLCPEDNYEDQYMRLLNQVKTFEVNDLRLNLKDNNNTVLLEFVKPSGTRNSIRIHDIWSAVRIEGYPINRMVTVPRLEINTKDMKIYGNDGCNDYFASIDTITENKISFTGIGSTRKMCQDMEIPERYMKALNKTTNYRFEENFLIITDIDNNQLLAFIKGD